MNRRHFARIAAFAGASSVATTRFATVIENASAAGDITVDTIARAEKIAGLEFSDDQRQTILEDVIANLAKFEEGRLRPLPNSMPPAFRFDPSMFTSVEPRAEGISKWSNPTPRRPGSEEILAFMTIAELGYLLRNSSLTSVDLTTMCLRRLRKYDPILECVVSLTESRAVEKAKLADDELSRGIDRGPLHGIPYGAKDLLAVDGYRTTWGAEPYKDQRVNETAEVIRRLDEAGAVLVAKLTLGALAWGDVWFGGRTNSPWNLARGSSGSSAGPGAAVAAGLVPFAIGSETLGSIVSPSTRNAVTGHRPTFGAVSRHGAMTLSWTMDKLGPMCRSAECCSLVFDTIRGKDSKDPTTKDQGFAFDASINVAQVRVGFVEEAFSADSSSYGNASHDMQSLSVLRSMGVDLVPVDLPNDMPLETMLLALNVEAAAAFDDLIRSNESSSMVRQDLWPDSMRTSRLIPAVEYVQANRHRMELIQRMDEVMKDVDVFVSPSFRGGTLRITNLTGHPCVCVPNAFHELEDNRASPRRNPGSITFIGGLYQDDVMLSVAHAYQQVTDFHKRRPPIR